MRKNFLSNQTGDSRSPLSWSSSERQSRSSSKVPSGQAAFPKGFEIKTGFPVIYKEPGIPQSIHSLQMPDTCILLNK